MVVNPSFPAKTVPEFIAYAKANPGKINMSIGRQSAACNHVAGELFKMMTGVRSGSRAYRGSQLPDLLGGQVQVIFDPLPSSSNHPGRQAARSGGDGCDALRRCCRIFRP